MSGYLASAFGASQSVADDGHWMLRAMGLKTTAGVSVSEYTAMNITSVYSAVGIIADTIAQLPAAVYRRTDAGREVVNDHPLTQALALQPNAYMGAFSQRQTSQSHALLWGNGYIEIERNGRGQAIGLWPLMPDQTIPERRAAELRYRVTIDGEQFSLAADRVAHIRAVGHDGYNGLSQIRLHAQALGLALSTERFGAKFFANDAAAGGFLYHPGRLGEKAQENLRNSIEKQGGLDNAHRVKILEEGMKYQQITIPPEDAQFLGTRSFQVEEVARIYRVPLILLQSHEKTTSWGSGIEQLIIGFVVWTLQPWIVQWEQELTRKALTPTERKQGLFVKFALQALLRGDMAGRAAFYKTLAEISALSPNEIRELEDRNTDPSLSHFYLPRSWQRTDEPAETPEQQAAAQRQRDLDEAALNALRD